MSCSNLPSRIQSTLILQTPESLVGVMGKKGYKVSTFFSLNRQRENWVHFGGCSWGVLFAKMLVEVTITCDIISDSSITQLYRQLSATGVFFLGGGRGGCEFCHYGNNNKIPLCMANCTTGLLEKKQNKKLTQIKLLICWHLSMIWQQLNPLCEFFLCMFKMKKCVGNKKNPQNVLPFAYLSTSLRPKDVAYCAESIYLHPLMVCLFLALLRSPIISSSSLP